MALSKIGAAIWTGSAAMTSEAIHSIVDTTNEILLLHGIHRSGRELYFWSFVVSLLIFALGAGFSIYERICRVSYPVPIKSPVVSYVALALSFLFEGGAWLYSLRQFRRASSLTCSPASRRSHRAGFKICSPGTGPAQNPSTWPPARRL